MKHPALALFTFLSSTPALADTVFCRADFDESSHYELLAETGKPIDFHFLTGDGMDLGAQMTPEKVEIVRGEKIAVSGKSESMGVDLHAKFENGKYNGTLLVNFDLEHADPVELDASCEIR